MFSRSKKSSSDGKKRDESKPHHRSSSEATESSSSSGHRRSSSSTLPSLEDSDALSSSGPTSSSSRHSRHPSSSSSRHRRSSSSVSGGAIDPPSRGRASSTPTRHLVRHRSSQSTPNALASAPSPTVPVPSSPIYPPSASRTHPLMSSSRHNSYHSSENEEERDRARHRERGKDQGRRESSSKGETSRSKTREGSKDRHREREDRPKEREERHRERDKERERARVERDRQRERDQEKERDKARTEEQPDRDLEKLSFIRKLEDSRQHIVSCEIRITELEEEVKREKEDREKYKELARRYRSEYKALEEENNAGFSQLHEEVHRLRQENKTIQSTAREETRQKLRDGAETQKRILESFLETDVYKNVLGGFGPEGLSEIGNYMLELNESIDNDIADIVDDGGPDNYFSVHPFQSVPIEEAPFASQEVPILKKEMATLEEKLMRAENSHAILEAQLTTHGGDFFPAIETLGRKMAELESEKVRESKLRKEKEAECDALRQLNSELRRRFDAGEQPRSLANSPTRGRSRRRSSSLQRDVSAAATSNTSAVTVTPTDPSPFNRGLGWYAGEGDESPLLPSPMSASGISLRPESVVGNTRSLYSELEPSRRSSVLSMMSRITASPMTNPFPPALPSPTVPRTALRDSQATTGWNENTSLLNTSEFHPKDTIAKLVESVEVAVGECDEKCRKTGQPILTLLKRRLDGILARFNGSAEGTRNADTSPLAKESVDDCEGAKSDTKGDETAEKDQVLCKKCQKPWEADKTITTVLEISNPLTSLNQVPVRSPPPKFKPPKKLTHASIQTESIHMTSRATETDSSPVKPSSLIPNKEHPDTATVDDQKEENQTREQRIDQEVGEVANPLIHTHLNQIQDHSKSSRFLYLLQYCFVELLLTMASPLIAFSIFIYYTTTTPLVQSVGSVLRMLPSSVDISSPTLMASPRAHQFDSILYSLPLIRLVVPCYEILSTCFTRVVPFPVFASLGCLFQSYIYQPYLQSPHLLFYRLSAVTLIFLAFLLGLGDALNQERLLWIRSSRHAQQYLNYTAFKQQHFCVDHSLLSGWNPLYYALSFDYSRQRRF